MAHGCAASVHPSSRSAVNGSVTLLFTTTPFTATFACGGTFISANIRYPLGATDAGNDAVKTKGCPPDTG